MKTGPYPTESVPQVSPFTEGEANAYTIVSFKNGIVMKNLKTVCAGFMFLFVVVPFAMGQTKSISRADADRFITYFYDSIRYEADLGTLQKIYPQFRRMLPYKNKRNYPL